MENTESRLDTTMKKIAKVMHMSNGKLCRQSENMSNREMWRKSSTHVKSYLDRSTVNVKLG